MHLQICGRFVQLFHFFGKFWNLIINLGTLATGVPPATAASTATSHRFRMIQIGDLRFFVDWIGWFHWYLDLWTWVLAWNWVGGLSLVGVWWLWVFLVFVWDDWLGARAEAWTHWAVWLGVRGKARSKIKKNQSKKLIKNKLIVF